MSRAATRLSGNWLSLFRKLHPEFTRSDTDVFAALSRHFGEERRERILRVASRRNVHLTVVLEGLYDMGNVGAVLRSCDAFGVQNIHVVNPLGDKYKATRNVSAGAERWLTVRRWADSSAALAALKRDGYRIAVADARPPPPGGLPITVLENVAVDQPLALVFGNEHGGISPEAMALSDVKFAINMSGFVESLNVSVAAAVTLHALTLRTPEAAGLSAEDEVYLRAEFAIRQVLHVKGGPDDQQLHDQERQKTLMLRLMSSLA